MLIIFILWFFIAKHSLGEIFALKIWIGSTVVKKGDLLNVTWLYHLKVTSLPMSRLCACADCARHYYWACEIGKAWSAGFGKRCYCHVTFSRYPFFVKAAPMKTLSANNSTGDFFRIDNYYIKMFSVERSIEKTYFKLYWIFLFLSLLWTGKI